MTLLLPHVQRRPQSATTPCNEPSRTASRWPIGPSDLLRSPAAAASPTTKVSRSFDPKAAQDSRQTPRPSIIGQDECGNHALSVRLCSAKLTPCVELCAMIDRQVGFNPAPVTEHSRKPQNRLSTKAMALPSQPTVGCLFSGMGGFASGFASSGFKIVWATDEDSVACETFRHRFRGVRVIQKDVCDVHVTTDTLPPVDILIAGFPCQSFSQAGRRQGFNDPRGQLFLEIPRLLQEYQSKHKPKLLVLENVPHLLFGADGAWFERIQYTIRRSGYWFRQNSCWIANVGAVTGLPQDRNRLFMVAASRRHYRYNPFSPPDSTEQINQTPLKTIHDLIDRSKRHNDADYLDPTNTYYRMIDDAMSNGQSPLNVYQLRRSYVREKLNGLCPTLTANMGTGGHNVPFIRDKWGIRRLSVDEIARLQGFDDQRNQFPSIPNSEKYRLLGNAVCVKLAQVLARECREILMENP